MEPKKVLLAEDDLDDQKLFQEFLHHRTDVVLLPIAENGVTLLNMLEEIKPDVNLPDLIVLDQNMPKKSGVQTLQALKESSRYAHIPVVVYSTYSDQQLINTCQQMGAAVVTSKPLSQKGYNEMMDSFLNILA